ncbi:hypothetical protein [Bradyrhizobium sp. CCGUVB23]|uniref:hypothetical protein n=1 Tax=Bradyrhizobium sp. CCGUVB23 TaxID=2949630 RepID=UPI0020B21A7B|nr:hypothetical protein [Bradyrhizobium sp. CCGUVB23]MCP3460833.1 hypothetical protein [Bradyrhizobium sp. CCGUVB23]
MTEFPQGRPGRAKCADRFSERVESLDGKSSDGFLLWPFMDPEGLMAKGLRPANFRRAYLERFALRLSNRATLVAYHKGRVYGTIATLTHAELDRLYSEPSVAAYRPEPVLARLADGTAELALCFNLPTIPDDRTTDPGYVADLRAIARKVGLSESYVASIGKDE